MGEIIYHDGTNFVKPAKLEYEDSPKLQGNLNSNNKIIKEHIIKNYGEKRVDGFFEETIDVQDGNIHKLYLRENITSLTITAPSTPNSSHILTLIVIQDSILRTIQWPATIIWNNDDTPALDTPNGIYFITLIKNSNGTNWYGNWTEFEYEQYFLMANSFDERFLNYNYKMFNEFDCFKINVTNNIITLSKKYDYDNDRTTNRVINTSFCGNYIAYSATDVFYLFKKDSNFDLTLIQDKEDLPYTTFQPLNIQWSPDGKYLGLAGSFGTYGVGVILEFDKNAETLTHKDGITSQTTSALTGTAIDFSPDNKFLMLTLWYAGSDPADPIMYLLENNNGQLIIRDEYKTNVPIINWAQKWSPDGKYVVFRENNLNLAVLENNNGSLTKIEDHENIATAAMGWSPSGKYFIAKDNNNKKKLLLFSHNGSGNLSLKDEYIHGDSPANVQFYSDKFIGILTYSNNFCVYNRRNSTTTNYDQAIINILNDQGLSVNIIDNNDFDTYNFSDVGLVVIGADGTNYTQHPKSSKIEQLDIPVISFCGWVSRNTLGMQTSSTTQSVSQFTILDEDYIPFKDWLKWTGTKTIGSSQTSHVISSFTSGTKHLAHNGTSDRAGIAEKLTNGHCKIHFGYHRMDEQTEDGIVLLKHIIRYAVGQSYGKFYLFSNDGNELKEVLSKILIAGQSNFVFLPPSIPGVSTQI